MARAPFSSNNLQNFIDDHGIVAKILTLSDNTPTVLEAARALHVAPEHIVKSLVFMSGSEPLIVISNGVRRVDRKKLAGHLGVGKNRVKLTSPEKALIFTGYHVGSMPPFGHLKRLKTVVDTLVCEQEVVYGGGGEINAMMRVESAELLKITDAEIADVSK